jgi:hypothetical protein
LQRAVAPLLRQLAERDDQVAAHRAADAAVAHFDDLLVAILDQDLVVDVFLAEFILDDGDLHAVLFIENPVQQRGLTGAEKAGENGGGYQGHGMAI